VTNPMMTALSNSLLMTKEDLTASLRTVYPSGDCTFPPYASFGVCSRCADVTHLIKSTKHGDNITLPNGLQAWTGSCWAAYTITKTSANGKLNSDTLAECMGDGTTGNFSILTSQDSSGLVDQAPSTFSAVDYTLHFCAHSYNSFMSSNIYHEHVKRPIENPAWNFLPP
jgi:hypothetical protein